MTDLPHRPGDHELADPGEEGVVAVVESLHQHQVGTGVGGGHRPGLVGVGREGFLAQDVLAGGHGRHGPVTVQAVGQGVVDGVDVGIGHELFVGIEDPGDAVLGGEGLRPGPVAGGHRHHLDALHPAARFDDGGRGDPGGAEDADAQGSHAGRLSRLGGPGPPIPR